MVDIPSDLVGSGEIARFYNVSVRTIKFWVDTGRLTPALRTPGGRFRFRRPAMTASSAPAPAAEPLDSIFG